MIGIESMTANEFALYQKLIYDTCGINLTEGKKQLLVSRLKKRMDALHITSFKAYREFVTSPKNEHEFSLMLNAVSTNKTDFFREPVHFDFMNEHVYPKLAKQSQIRIWCAASSSGEEPFTIAMTLQEAMHGAKKDVKILATDISTKVLGEAERAVYSADNTAPILPSLLKKYFLKGSGEWEGHFLVKDELKDLVHFKRLNLMEPFPLTIEFDVIFCRNVMIYFDKETREQLVGRMEKHLKIGGYLFIGNAESLSGLKHNYKYVQPAVYQRVKR